MDENAREKFEPDGRVSICASHDCNCNRLISCWCAGINSYFWQQLSARVMAKLPRKRTLGVWLADTPNGAGGGVWPAPHLSSLPPGSFVPTPFDIYCLSWCMCVCVFVCLCVLYILALNRSTSTKACRVQPPLLTRALQQWCRLPAQNGTECHSTNLCNFDAYLVILQMGSGACRPSYCPHTERIGRRCRYLDYHPTFEEVWSVRPCTLLDCAGEF